MKGTVIEIDTETAMRFILPRHYSGRKPSVSKAYGWYDGQNYTDEHLMAAITFGKPASPNICVGICGGGVKNLSMNLTAFADVKNGKNRYLNSSAPAYEG